MYRKEIIYLGLYKDGDRLGSAGFLKVEKKDKDASLSLVMKNVPQSIKGKYPVRYFNGSDWKEEDGITVQEGGGRWEKREQDIMEQVRLQIRLPGGYLVEGAGREPVRQTPAQTAEEKRERLIDAEPAAEQSAVSEPERDLPEQEAAEGERPTAAQPDAGPEMTRQKEPVGEPAAISQEENAMEAAMPLTELSAVEKSELESIVRQKPQKTERIVVQRQNGREKGTAYSRPQKPLMADTFVIEGLKEDKWEQILDTYDNIHPYGDERIYVKLEPKDFIILSAKYQHLVNNSFLLHGFYNYRHVIVGKEGEIYYLGVPGVFYEREKMVALMFGFEAFECGSGDPSAGEFGYYLRKVEL